MSGVCQWCMCEQCMNSCLDPFVVGDVGVERCNVNSDKDGIVWCGEVCRRWFPILYVKLGESNFLNSSLKTRTNTIEVNLDGRPPETSVDRAKEIFRVKRGRNHFVENNHRRGNSK